MTDTTTDEDPRQETLDHCRDCGTAAATIWKNNGKPRLRGTDQAATPAYAMRIDLEPGDMTLYRLLISSPAAPLVRFPAERLDVAVMPENRHWTVTLFGFGAGKADTWDCATIDAFTAYERWGSGNEWTGKVLAAFLSAFAAEIAAAD